MSTTSNDASATKKRKINPATCTCDELLTHLSTDPGTGLSVKEAERRRDRSLTPSLFERNTRTNQDRLWAVVRDVSLWLLMVVSVLALFFDRIALGVVCLVLTVGHGVICILLSRRADRVDAAMQATDVPLARVLRSRRVRRMEADSLVPGDILLLHPGDMVPADARLLRTEDFVVSERPLVARQNDRPTAPERLCKNADTRPESGAIRRHSPENMVFAGGVVEAGFAVAVVVAVGRNTHLGGLIGEVPSAHPSRMPTVLERVKRPLSIINLCLIALIIPLTVVGILTLRDRYELLDIVLPSVAFSALMLTEHVLIRGRSMAAVHRRDAACRRDGVNTADIKSGTHLEKLTTLTDLLLVGTAALHDGKSHPVALRIGTTEYRCDRPDADDPVRSLVELLTIYATPPTDSAAHDRTAPIPSLRRELEHLIPTLIEWSDMDREALAVKAADIRCEDGWVSVVLPTIEGNRRIGIRLTENFDDLYACHDCFTAGPLRTAAQKVPPDVRPSPADERLSELRRAYSNACRDGLSAFFVITAVGGRSTIHAMVTYAPKVSPKTAGCIRSFEAAGVRVSAYLRDVTFINDRVLSACGLADAQPISRLERGEGTARLRRPAAELLKEGYRAFEGCDEDYIRTAIRDLKAEGRKVAVLSVDARDIALLDEADLAVTCSPSMFESAEEGEMRICELSGAAASALAGRDGSAEGMLATDLCRRRADVLVRRATETGGGVNGFKTALLAADRYKTALDRFYTYLIAVQMLRFVTLLIPLCLGFVPVSAVAFLLSGFLGDAFVYAVLVNLKGADAPAPRRSMEDRIGQPYRTHGSILLVTLIAAVLPWIVVGIAKLLDVDFGADLTHYALLCLLGCQTALYRTEILPKRNRTVFFGTLTMVLLYVGALAGALGAGLGLLWAIITPVVVCLLYGIALYYIRRK